MISVLLLCKSKLLWKLLFDDESLTKYWRESEKTLKEWFWQSLEWVRIADPHQIILKPAADRLSEESLLTYCEVDMFSPFLVKDGWEI